MILVSMENRRPTDPRAQANGANQAGKRGNRVALSPPSQKSCQYTAEQKLRIFSDLFRGRSDVYPIRWENQSRGTAGYMPDCRNKFVQSLCDIRRTKCSQCNNQAFRRLDSEAIEEHLRGHHTLTRPMGTPRKGRANQPRATWTCAEAWRRTEV